MDIRLNGKMALITGGSLGMGKAIAEKFAASGAEVAIVARRAEPLAATADAIVAARGHCRAYAGDVSRADEVSRLFAAITADLGRVDILVNNAGDAGQDRALPPLVEESHSAGALLSARGARSTARGVRQLLQQPALP
jgi:3-oxoacyl-[acyl-carrier protein] reductase